MDPFRQVAPGQPVYPIFLAGVFETNHERDKYLDSLDSDTKAYVVNHTSEFSTREDIIDCVRRLHGER